MPHRVLIQLYSTPQLLIRDRRALAQGAQLGPGDLRMDAADQATVDAGDDDVFRGRRIHRRRVCDPPTSRARVFNHEGAGPEEEQCCGLKFYQDELPRFRNSGNVKMFTDNDRDQSAWGAAIWGIPRPPLDNLNVSYMIINRSMKLAIREYLTPQGKNPFREWLKTLGHGCPSTYPGKSVAI
jgi:hypothetical protein